MGGECPKAEGEMQYNSPLSFPKACWKTFWKSLWQWQHDVLPSSQEDPPPLLSKKNTTVYSVAVSERIIDDLSREEESFKDFPSSSSSSLQCSKSRVFVQIPLFRQIHAAKLVLLLMRQYHPILRHNGALQLSTQFPWMPVPAKKLSCNKVQNYDSCGLTTLASSSLQVATRFAILHPWSVILHGQPISYSDLLTHILTDITKQFGHFMK